MVSSFFHLWDVGCLIVFFHPMMSMGLLVGLCWVSCLAGVSVGEVPQKKRPFGGLLFSSVGGENRGREAEAVLEV